MSTQSQISSWHKTLSELEPRQREVVAYLQIHKRASAWEMAANLKRFVHAVRPRLTELEKLGVIRAAGARYEPTTDRKETVWELARIEQEQLRLAI